MKYKEGLWHEHVYFYQEDLVKDPNIIFANITCTKFPVSADSTAGLSQEETQQATLIAR